MVLSRSFQAQEALPALKVSWLHSTLYAAPRLNALLSCLEDWPFAEVLRGQARWAGRTRALAWAVTPRAPEVLVGFDTASHTTLRPEERGWAKAAVSSGRAVWVWPFCQLLKGPFLMEKSEQTLWPNQ